MKKIVFMLVAMAMLARADTIIDFNDLGTPNSSAGIADWGVIPTAYAGFVWSGWEVVDGATFNTAYASIFSGPFPNKAAYNGGDGNLTVTLSSANPFNLVGADFSSWAGIDPTYAATSVTVTGFLGGVQVEIPIVVSLTDGFLTTSIDLDDVDLVVFTTLDVGQYWLMDNMEVQTVSEPASALLILGGLLFLLVRRSRNLRSYFR